MMTKRKYAVKKTATGWRIDRKNGLIFGGECSTREEAEAEIENILAAEADARAEADAEEDIHCFII